MVVLEVVEHRPAMWLLDIENKQIFLRRVHIMPAYVAIHLEWAQGINLCKL